MKKAFLILGMIILIIFLGIIIFNYQEEQFKAKIPYIEIEATVISLSLDEKKNYSEGEEIFSIPSDSATVRIDKIIETEGSYNFDWFSIGIEEGKEVSLDFKYTARPAKIINFVGKTLE